METPKIAAYTAPVLQEDGSIWWQSFKTEEEARAADYRTKIIEKLEDLKVDASRRGKSFMEERNALTAKLAEQQQINAQLQQALADTTGHVLTLCKALGRLMG